MPFVHPKTFNFKARMKWTLVGGSLKFFRKKNVLESFPLLLDAAGKSNTNSPVLDWGGWVQAPEAFKKSCVKKQFACRRIAFEYWGANIINHNLRSNHKSEPNRHTHYINFIFWKKAKNYFLVRLHVRYPLRVFHVNEDIFCFCFRHFIFPYPTL